MHFDEDYFKPGERSGYYLNSMQRRFQAATIECLAEIDRICRKNKLTYYVFYGTLLGAVRHQGFIPWDDDVDIVMMRPDYEKFKKIAPDKLKAPFHLYNEQDSCIFPLRVNNTYYTCMKPDFLEQFHNCPYPVGIDIFVLDKMPPEGVERETTRILHQLIKYMSMHTDFRYERVYGHESNIEADDIEEALQGIEEFTGQKITRDKTVAAQLTKLSHAVAAMYMDVDSDWIVRMESWSVNPKRGKFPKECFGRPIDMDFDGLKVMAPKGYDTILTSIYGDYMVPRIGKAMHAAWKYKKQEKDLLDIFKKCGATPPEFLFE